MHNICIVFIWNDVYLAMHILTFCCKAVLKMNKTSITILEKMKEKKKTFERSFPQKPCNYTIWLKQYINISIENEQRQPATPLEEFRRERKKTNQTNIFIAVQN